MNKDTQVLFEAYKNLRDSKFENMTPEERETYEQELDKKEAYKKSLTDHNSEDAEGGSWDPMTNLAPKAQQIHDILSECGDDELTPAQCEKAADIIIGGPNEWEQQDYIRMLKGLSFVLQKMCIRSMN